MALTLSQGTQLRADPGYQARIYSAMTRYALTVMAEAIGAMTTTVFAKRKILANRVLTSPTAWIDPFVAMVASDPGASLTWFGRQHHDVHRALRGQRGGDGHWPKHGDGVGRHGQLYGAEQLECDGRDLRR